MGRNPAEAGIRIRSNFLQDIGNQQANVTGIQGVYVDDRSGLVEVSGNIFNRVGSGVHAAAFKVNGGKHNRFSGNLVVGGRGAYLQVHDTPDKAWSEWYARRDIADKLAKVDATNPDSPWSQRYPLAHSAIEDVQQPPTTTNVLEDNIILDGELVYGIIGGRYGDPLPTRRNNYEIDQDPGFRDLAEDDFHIPKEAWQRKFPEIEWIDFERIGLSPKSNLQ